MQISNSRARGLILIGISLGLFLALAVAVASGTTLGFDNAVRQNIHSSATASLTSIAFACAFIGSLQVIIPLTVVAVAVLWHRTQGKLAITFGAVMGGALILNWVLKNAIGRIRPEPFFGVEPETFSFPSGHVLFSACFLCGLWLLRRPRPKYRWVSLVAALLVVGAVGWSRIYLGVHYPTDVLGGGLVAIVWLGAVYTGAAAKTPTVP